VGAEDPERAHPLGFLHRVPEVGDRRGLVALEARALDLLACVFAQALFAHRPLIHTSIVASVPERCLVPHDCHLGVLADATIHVSLCRKADVHRALHRAGLTAHPPRPRLRSPCSTAGVCRWGGRLVGRGSRVPQLVPATGRITRPLSARVTKRSPRRRCRRGAGIRVRSTTGPRRLKGQERRHSPEALADSAPDGNQGRALPLGALACPCAYCGPGDLPRADPDAPTRNRNAGPASLRSAGGRPRRAFRCRAHGPPPAQAPRRCYAKRRRLGGAHYRPPDTPQDPRGSLGSSPPAASLARPTPNPQRLRRTRSRGPREAGLPPRKLTGVESEASRPTCESSRHRASTRGRSCKGRRPDPSSPHRRASALIPRRLISRRRRSWRRGHRLVRDSPYGDGD